MKLFRSSIWKFGRFRRLGRYRANPAKGWKGYSTRGLPAVIKTPGQEYKGVIEEQVFGGVHARFKLRLMPPQPFHEIASSVVGREGKEEVAKFRSELFTLGCLQEEATGAIRWDRVNCLWGRWSDISLIPRFIKKGQPLELSSRDVTSTPVRFVKWLKRYTKMLVWFPEPMTYFDIRHIYDWRSVTPKMISKDSYFMSFHQYKAMYKAGIPMPRARRKRMGGLRLMEFIEPIPWQDMARRLAAYRKHLVESGKRKATDVPPWTVWESVLSTVFFHMAPVDIEKRNIAVRPMREDLFSQIVVPAEDAFRGL